jgi:hypothetical protein
VESSLVEEGIVIFRISLEDISSVGLFSFCKNSKTAVRGLFSRFQSNLLLVANILELFNQTLL